MLTDIKIDFHSRVSRSGYKIIKRVETAKSINQWTLSPVRAVERELIIPHNDDAEVREVVHDINVLKHFKKLIKLREEGKLTNSGVLNFCNIYGLTQNARQEGLEEFNEFLDFMKLQEQERSSGKLIQIERGYIPQFVFEIWEGGKIYPTYKPTNLREAIYISWIFSFQSLTLRKCKYFSDYGSREGCHEVFEPRRADAEFCSNGGKCRAAWHQKRA